MNLTQRMLVARVDYKEYVNRCDNAARVVLYIASR